MVDLIDLNFPMYSDFYSLLSIGHKVNFLIVVYFCVNIYNKNNLLDSYFT